MIMMVLKNENLFHIDKEFKPQIKPSTKNNLLDLNTTMGEEGSTT